MPVAGPVTLTFALVLFGVKVPVPVHNRVGVGVPVMVAPKVSALPAQSGLLLVGAVIWGTVQKFNFA